MPIDNGNLALKGLDDLFSTEENRQEEQREQVQQIPIDALHPFTNHPFKVLDDEAMTRIVESIAQYGVLAPLIARPRPDGDGYEIISGHRRQYAATMTFAKSWLLPVCRKTKSSLSTTQIPKQKRRHCSPKCAPAMCEFCSEARRKWERAPTSSPDLWRCITWMLAGSPAT